ncbi:MAG: hypothetical protein AB7P07_12145 [Hyphomonadaceae bacterium]
MKPFLIATAAAALMSLGACGQTTTVERESSVEEAAEDFGNELEQAGQNIEEAAEDAGNEIEQAGENAADSVDDATDGNPSTNP